MTHLEEVGLQERGCSERQDVASLGTLAQLEPAVLATHAGSILRQLEDSREDSSPSLRQHGDRQGAVLPVPYAIGAGYIFSAALLQWVATSREANCAPSAFDPPPRPCYRPLALATAPHPRHTGGCARCARTCR